MIYRVRGELDEALAYHKDALAIDREIGYKQGEADQLGNIGLIRYVGGELDEALAYLEDALKIFISIGTHPQVLQVYSYLFQVSIKEDPVKAFSYMKKALEYAPDEEKALRTIFTFLSLIANLIRAAQWEHLQHITTAQSHHFTELNPFFAAINYYARYQLSKQKDFLKKYEKERKTLNKTLLEILDNLFEKE